MKTPIAFILGLWIAVIPAHADPIPVTVVTPPDAVTVKSTLTAEQASALFATFSLPSNTTGKIPFGVLHGNRDGTVDITVTFKAPPVTPTASPTPTP